MSILSILGIGNGKIKDAIRHGAIVIDVRKANEFDQGRVSTRSISRLTGWILILKTYVLFVTYYYMF